VKKNKLPVICSWALLICFIAGQYMVYAHQHQFIKGAVKSVYTSQKQQQIIKERCYLCDAMHHQAAIIDDLFHFAPQVIEIHFYKTCDYDFVSMGLVLAAGRAPPVLS
jgi:hypothetical protein